MAERISSYRYGEGETKAGQVVQFTAPLDEFELAKESLKHFRDIALPVSTQVNVEHGGFGRYSRYEIDQVEYGGGQNEDGGGGYYEILAIKNPPEGRHPFVSHGYFSSGSYLSQYFVEWESTEAAQTHWRKEGRGRILTGRSFEGDTSEVPGLLRVVNTGYLSPWFYATGNASLVGDYVFPEHLKDDPVFTLGRAFLVPEKSEEFRAPVRRVLKTCMGCAVDRRFVYDYRLGARKEVTYRAVQWHDGSITELFHDTPIEGVPSPLAETDTWVVEAQQKFNELLSGYQSQFEVKFANGGKFVGRYIAPKDEPKKDLPGDYYLSVTFANGESVEGWVDSFEPSDTAPTIASLVEQRYAKAGREVARIEMVKKRTVKGEKKWPGVYHGSTEFVDPADPKTE